MADTNKPKGADVPQERTVSEKVDAILSGEEKEITGKDREKMRMFGGLQAKYSRTSDAVYLYGSATHRSEILLLKNVTVELTLPDGKIITLDGLDRRAHIKIPGKLFRAANNIAIKFKNIEEDSEK